MILYSFFASAPCKLTTSKIFSNNNRATPRAKSHLCLCQVHWVFIVDTKGWFNIRGYIFRHYDSIKPITDS